MYYCWVRDYPAPVHCDSLLVARTALRAILRTDEDTNGRPSPIQLSVGMLEAHALALYRTRKPVICLPS